MDRFGEAYEMGVDLVRFIRWVTLGEAYKMGYAW
ncbi:MAG: hypothetical protein Faunusvirus50_1 [Faunusvirus sp.]|uniref:Uncharacterized protein n=1 Tax=Faunusvirus sp. TaxID=2487766 RepID=A0A3G4ZXX7_9VIRU|nr:MAG: hypothetical protein Faunusvirus50_1 [Faunusvirus sp.]